MSRSLGQNVQRKKAIAATSPEQEGAAAHAAGVPISANPYGHFAATTGHGKAYAWNRGWQRAATAKRSRR